MGNRNQTTYLCIDKETLDNLFEVYPKSKVIIQKRALERRMVFMNHLKKLEKVMKKNQKML